MGRRIWGLGLVALLIVTTSIAACRQLVGITDNPPEDLVTSICGLPYGTNVCASCVSANCCAESNACAGDAVCSAYESCLGACNGEPKCRSQCTIDNPGVTSSDVSALSACLASNCESPCGLTCGGIADLVSEPDAAGACQMCVAQTTSNCASAKECAASGACDAYIRCFLACFAGDCRDACASANAEGAALFAPFQNDPNGPLTYFGGACSGPCGAGTDWACVGHVTWPSPKSPTVTLTEKIVDNQSGSPVSGLNVSICNGCPCPSPSNPLLGDAQTDDAGIYSVQIPNPSGIGNIGLNGCAQYHPDPDSGITPEFAYWGYPLSEAQAVDTATSTEGRTITSEETASIYGVFGVPLDPTGAPWLTLFVLDCLGSLASGVQITIQPNAQVPEFYNVPGGASLTATQTSSQGSGGFLNVPPGQYTVTATPLSLGKPASQIVVNVQAGTVTGALMFPTPMSP
jgi:hypothetical protein